MTKGILILSCSSKLLEFLYFDDHDYNNGNNDNNEHNEINDNNDNLDNDDNGDNDGDGISYWVLKCFQVIKERRYLVVIKVILW